MSVMSSALEVGFDIVRFIIKAIQEGDEPTWRAFADILPTPLKSRVELLAQQVEAENRIQGVLNFDE